MRTGRGLQSSLITQAAITALFSMAAMAHPAWFVFELVLAVGCGAVAWFVGTGSPQTRQVVLTFEIVAVAVGVLGLLSGHYIPGTIMAIFTLVSLLNGSASTTPTVGCAAPPQYAATQYPQPYAAPQLASPPSPCAPFAPASYIAPMPPEGPYAPPAVPYVAPAAEQPVPPYQAPPPPRVQPGSTGTTILPGL